MNIERLRGGLLSVLLACAAACSANDPWTRIDGYWLREDYSEHVSRERSFRVPPALAGDQDRLAYGISGEYREIQRRSGNCHVEGAVNEGESVRFVWMKDRPCAGFPESVRVLSGGELEIDGSRYVRADSRWINQATVAGLYADARGNRYELRPDGTAVWPGRSSRYVVTSDPSTQPDLIVVDDKEQCFSWRGGVLELRLSEWQTVKTRRCVGETLKLTRVTAEGTP